jgi:hypothetical protein
LSIPDKSWKLKKKKNSKKFFIFCIFGFILKEKVTE